MDHHSGGRVASNRTRTWQEIVYLAARRLFERVTRSEQQRKIDRILLLMERIAAAQKQDAKWRMIFRRQVNSLLRHRYLIDRGLASPEWLAAHRFRLRSQNEEDGITLALLDRAGSGTRRFVEIGPGSTGGNSAVLAFEAGWSGLMIDASKKAVMKLSRSLRFNPGVTVVNATVTPENINEILTRHGCTGDVDFVSIDVDSIDFWLLDALRVCSPRVLVMEYNALFGPDRAVTVPNAPEPKLGLKGYSGASLRALERKAREKGLRLVLCEDAGVNAFFLRNDVAPQIAAVPAADAFRPWKVRIDLGDAPKEIDIYATVEELGLPLVDLDQVAAR
jgi:hypothetical protein